MRDYCGFEKVPDAAKLTRFKQGFCEYIRDVFERLVDMTEPICAEMDKALADIRVYDTTGIESYVAENNPKFIGKMAGQSRSIARLDPSFISGMAKGTDLIASEIVLRLRERDSRLKLIAAIPYPDFGLHWRRNVFRRCCLRRT